MARCHGPLSVIALQRVRQRGLSLRAFAPQGDPEGADAVIGRAEHGSALSPREADQAMGSGADYTASSASDAEADEGRKPRMPS